MPIITPQDHTPKERLNVLIPVPTLEKVIKYAAYVKSDLSYAVNELLLLVMNQDEDFDPSEVEAPVTKRKKPLKKKAVAV